MNEQLMLAYMQFEAAFMFWVKEAPMVFKGIACREPYEIPRVRLSETTWGKNLKELYGKEIIS